MKRVMRSLKRHGIDFRKQGFNHLVLRNFPKDLSLTEQNSTAIAARNTDIRLSRFTRTIHRTAHDGDLYRLAAICKRRFHLIRKRNQIDTRPAAGRTGNNLRTCFANICGL